MWPFRKDPETVEERVARAQKALDEKDPRQALEIAEQLLALQQAVGFELKARALAALGRRSDAIAVLEEGLRAVPHFARLWSCLGELRSDAGDFTGAHDAFRSAETVGAELRQESIANDALVYLREKNAHAALARIRDAGVPLDPALRSFAVYTRCSALIALGRHEEVITLCEAELVLLGDEDSRSKPALQLALAEALWRGRKDRVKSLALCRRSGARERGHADAFDLLREIEGLDGSSAKPWHLLCHGKVLEKADADGDSFEGLAPQQLSFLTTYRVLADTPQEALAFARQWEQEVFGDKLLTFELEHSTQTNDSVHGCKGVYWRAGGHTLYTGEAQTEERASPGRHGR